jgi:ribosomal protein S18 acetylase RimI-like enzyme
LNTNRGVGSGLIDFFEKELYPDAANLYLFVSDLNPNAQRLYLRLGYVPVGALPNYNLITQTEFMFRKTRGPRSGMPSPWIA